MNEPGTDLRERMTMDADFHVAVKATCRQAERDGGNLDPETVAKVLMAFDRSGAGSMVRLDGSAWPALQAATDEAARRFIAASSFPGIQPVEVFGHER